MTLTSSGHLLVGASSSSGVGASRVQIGSASAATAGLLTKSATSSLSLYASSTSASYQVWKSGTFMAFGEGPDDLSSFTERMRIDSSGNVGIGLTPSVKFQVAGTARVNQPGATRYRSDWYLESGGVFLNGYDDTAAAYIPVGFNFSTYTFSSGGSERMRIDSSGNVGIGISSPSYKLDVRSGATATAGQFNSTATTAYNPSGYNGGAARLFLYGGNSTNSFTGTQYTHGGSFEAFFGAVQNSSGLADFVFQGYNGSAYAERMRINSTGNLLIPNGVVSSQGWQSNGTSYTTASSIYNGVFAPADNTISVATVGTERMRITSAGFLLVGTTAPLSGNTSNEFKTTTAGSWPLTINSNDRGILHRQSSATTGFYEYFEYNGGTNNGSISYSGGTTAYNTTSDYRLKDIDGPLKNSGAYIDALKPVEGWWKADGKRFIGFLAHQVQEVSQTPVVVGEKDGAEMQQMDYSAPELIANLIAEVQSLRARVAQLEGN